MKKLILAFSLLLTDSIIANAQCGKKSVFTSSKTEYLDASGTVERSVDEKTVVEITKTDITITPGDHTMTGPIKSDTCNWKIPYKEGKSVIKAGVSDGQGEAKNVTITIEGKDGKITILAQVEDMPGKTIRITADKFEARE